MNPVLGSQTHAFPLQTKFAVTEECPNRGSKHTQKVNNKFCLKIVGKYVTFWTRTDNMNAKPGKQ